MIHPLSDVQSEQIGDGTHVWQFTVVLHGAVIGRDCSIGANCSVENDVKIGEGVTIKNGVQVWDRIVIGDGVFVDPNATFSNDLNPSSRRGAANKEPELQPTAIGEGASIGAGSVVIKDVPEFSLVYGSPTRVHGRVDEKGNIVERRKSGM